MVSTRSGRVVGAAAPGTEATTTPGPALRASGKGRSKAAATVAENADDDAALQGAAANGATGRPTMQTANDSPATAAPRSPEALPKFSERKVLLSPRRASPSPAGSPAPLPPMSPPIPVPASSAPPASPAGFVSSPGVVAAHILSSVPLPPSESDDDQRQSQGNTAPTSPAASPSHQHKPAAHATPAPRARTQKRQSRSPWVSLALAALVALLAAAAATLCCPDAAPHLTSLVPPSASFLPSLKRLPETSVCLSLSPASMALHKHARAAFNAAQPFTDQLCTKVKDYATSLWTEVQFIVQAIQRLASHATASIHPSPASGSRTAPPPPSINHHDHARLLLQSVVQELSPSRAASEASGGLGPVEEVWQVAVGDAAARQKALGVLLTCDSPAHCIAATSRLLSGGGGGSAAKLPSGCAVEVSLAAAAGRGTDEAGYLQQQLATLVAPLSKASASCPGLLVVVQGLDSAPLALASVFNNVLSESGNLQMGGEGVPMHRAVLVFPVAVAAEKPGSATPAAEDGEGRGEAVGADEGQQEAAEAAVAEVGQDTEMAWASGAAAYDAFARKMKAHLVERLTATWSQAVQAGGEGDEGGPAAEGQQQMALLRALRRRIDIVLQAGH